MLVHTHGLPPGGSCPPHLSWPGPSPCQGTYQPRFDWRMHANSSGLFLHGEREWRRTARVGTVGGAGGLCLLTRRGEKGGEGEKDSTVQDGSVDSRQLSSQPHPQPPSSLWPLGFWSLPLPSSLHLLSSSLALLCLLHYLSRTADQNPLLGLAGRGPVLCQVHRTGVLLRILKRRPGQARKSSDESVKPAMGAK